MRGRRDQHRGSHLLTINGTVCGRARRVELRWSLDGRSAFSVSAERSEPGGEKGNNGVYSGAYAGVSHFGTIERDCPCGGGGLAKPLCNRMPCTPEYLNTYRCIYGADRKNKRYITMGWTTVHVHRGYDLLTVNWGTYFRKFPEIFEMGRSGPMMPVELIAASIRAMSSFDKFLFVRLQSHCGQMTIKKFQD